MAKKKKAIGSDPLSENNQIMREFYKPSKNLKGKTSSKPVKQFTGKPASQYAGKSEKQPLVKATFYLNPENILALEELRLKAIKEQGEKIDKSTLVREAINLLVSQQASIPVKQ